MSEYFSGITFSDQLVTPSDDAILRRAILQDGILQGCSITYFGATLTVAPGYLLLCGRQIRHTAAHSWNMGGEAYGYARLVLSADLSKGANEDSFDQVYASIEYATAPDGFLPLVQEDINDSGTVYQMELCAVSLGAGGITGIIRAAPEVTSSKIYAPAGFGLGEASGKKLTALQDLDDLNANGFASLDLEASATLAGVEFIRAAVDIHSFGAGAVQQVVRPIGSTCRILRHSENGIWSPWCTENPPMLPGIEYRLAELWQNRPVFIKQIAYTADSFKSTIITLPHGITGLDVCLAISGIWKRTDIDGDGWRRIPVSDPDSGSLDGDFGPVTREAFKLFLGSTLQQRIQQSTEPIYITIRYVKA